MTTSGTVYTRFVEASGQKAFDRDHRRIMSHNINQYNAAFIKGITQFSDLNIARKRAAVRKHHVLEHLEDHLKSFEHNFTKNGGKVIWAQDAEDARQSILQIFNQHYVKSVVKSKSMITEEAGITSFLEKNGIDCLETDLGEYIVQISDDKPYHIVTPAMHLSEKDIAGIFHKKFGLDAAANAETITRFVRDTLRQKFEKADAGITGANFLISGSGSVAITENEGNGVLSMTFPKIHIVLAGIEKILPSLEDLDLFWPLLASHGTGQKLTAYNSLVHGPSKNHEADGPEHMYVILLDNGRTRLLKTLPQRRALACIRCGACLNVCPVYRNIGGHAYGTVYSGPVGAVISPHLLGAAKEYMHLSFASSLCGKCTEVCPVGIDLHQQLLHNRRLSVKSGFPSRIERWGIKAYAKVMGKRKWLDKPPVGMKNFLASAFFGKAWGNRRTLPKVKKSFKQRHEEGFGNA